MKTKQRRTFHRQLFAAAGVAWAAMALGGPLAELAWVILGLTLLIAYMAADDAHETAEPVWAERERRVEEMRRARQQTGA